MATYENPGFPVSNPGVSQSQEKSHRECLNVARETAFEVREEVLVTECQ